MTRRFARIESVVALAALSWIGCGGRTGALGGFDDNVPSGQVAGRPSGSSGAATGTDASGTGTSAGTGTSTTGASATAGTPAGTGTLATSGAATAGTFAIPPVGIPPVVAQGCDALCAKEASAMCPNQGPLESCVLTCRLLLNNPACAAQTQALFGCEQTSPVSCDGTGNATLDACGVQTLVSAACFVQSDNDPTLQGPCTKYCAQSAIAHCPSDDPSGCLPSCEVLGNLIPACDPLWRSYVTCAEQQSFVCGGDGKAAAPGCAIQGLIYLACTAQGATTVEDAGTP
jgi:hypothetical protein